MEETTNGNGKTIVNVEFKGESEKSFLSLKKRLQMENNNDVIRFAIAFTDKRYK